MIYAVKLREFNKSRRCLLRRWIHARTGMMFIAGDSTPRRPTRPSKIYEVTKDQYDYLTGKDALGNLNVSQPRNPEVPAFKGYTFRSRTELLAMVQGEADKLAAKGKLPARALVDFKGPVEKPVEKATEASELPDDDENTESFSPVDVDDELSGGAEEIDSGDADLEPEPEPIKKRRRGRPRKSS